MARGFTLIEMTLALILTAIIALSVVPIATHGLNAYVLTTNRARLLNDVRFALTRMSREILHIRAGDLRLMQPARVTFVDQQGQPADYGFIANGAIGTLYRTAIPVLKNVNDVQFRYFDGNGNVANLPANVRRIDAQITANAPVAGTVTLRTEIFLRTFAYTNFQ